MTDNPEFVDNDQTQQNGGSGLRAKLEQTLAELAKVKADFEALQSKETERAVTATWDELKVPAPIRDFYKGEQTPEAMKQWWEASKGFFNIEAVADDKQPEQTPEQQAQLQAAQQFQQASVIGTDSLTTGSDAAAQIAAQARGKTGADFDALRKQFYAANGTPEY